MESIDIIFNSEEQTLGINGKTVKLPHDQGYGHIIVDSRARSKDDRVDIVIVYTSPYYNPGKMEEENRRVIQDFVNRECPGRIEINSRYYSHQDEEWVTCLTLRKSAERNIEVHIK